MADSFMLTALQRRDHGWIHTLLEEAENERMHLMTFMTLKNPSRLFRAMVLGAQGVFYNAFCTYTSHFAQCASLTHVRSPLLYDLA